MASMISRGPPSSSKNKQGNLSPAAVSGAGIDTPSTCRHKDCPLYKAPPCFYRCVEKLLSTPYCVGTQFPDWKKFTGYFQLDQPVSEEGAIRYWAKGHEQKDRHTIQRVMDFAEELGHLPLLNQLEKLIEDHQQVNPGHVCTSNVADCFKRCEKCIERPKTAPTQKQKSKRDLRRTYSDTYPKIVKGQHNNKPSSHLQQTTELSPVEEDNTSTTSQESDKDHSTPGDESFDQENKSLTKVGTPPQESQLLPEDVIHILAPSLFEKEYPYKLFQYNYWILEPIIVLFLAFQAVASILITLCEDGGAPVVFQDGFNLSQFINRIISLVLRILVRVVTPFLFYMQLRRMSKAEKKRVIRSKKEDFTPPTHVTPIKHRHHVTLWSIIPHAVIFSILSLYLDAFLTAEDRLRGRGICIRELFQVQVPMIGMRLFVFCDCLACFFILMLVGLVKDCYCIENRLSTKVQSKYFDLIRKRWEVIDILCYTIPATIILITTVSLSYPTIPPARHNLEPGDIEMWSFWTITLSLLLFFGSSSNLTAKLVTIIGNIIVPCCALFFTFVLGVGRTTFPPGSSIILMYSYLCITTLNLLYCLLITHYRHKKLVSKRFWLSLILWILLILCLITIAINEVRKLAIFVNW